MGQSVFLGNVHQTVPFTKHMLTHKTSITKLIKINLHIIYINFYPKNVFLHYHEENFLYFLQISPKIVHLP